MYTVLPSLHINLHENIFSLCPDAILEKYPSFHSTDITQKQEAL